MRSGHIFTCDRLLVTGYRLLITGYCLLVTSSVFASGGETDKLFNYGVTARAMSMSNAYTSVAQDATAIYYNAGGTGRLQNKQVSFTHAALFQKTNYNYVGYGHPTRYGAFALGVVQLSAGGGVGKDSLNSPTGDFDYSETAISLGWGRRSLSRLKKLSYGFGVKTLERNLGGSSDRLSGFDLGAQYGPMFNDRLSMGLSLKNLVSLSSGDTDDKLPLRNAVGLSYLIIKSVMMSLDVIDLKEVSLGMEYSWGPMYLRAGYTSKKSGVGANMPVGGLGFSLLNFLKLDYSLADNPELGGLSHRFSVGMIFGTSRNVKNQGYANRYLIDFVNYMEAGQYMNSMSSYERAKELAYPTALENSATALYNKIEKLVSALNLNASRENQRLFYSNETSAVHARQSVKSLFDNQKEKALILAEAALGSKPDSLTYKNYLEFVEEETGLMRDPDEIVPLEYLVQVKLKKSERAFLRKRFHETVEICEQIIAVDPENVLAHTRLGSAYYLTGEKAKSLDEYQKALELNPDDKNLADFIEKKFKRLK